MEKEKKGKGKKIFFFRGGIEKTDDKIVLVSLIKIVIKNGNKIHMENGKLWKGIIFFWGGCDSQICQSSSYFLGAF